MTVFQHISARKTALSMELQSHNGEFTTDSLIKDAIARRCILELNAVETSLRAQRDPILNERQWDALEKAERPLYANQSGANAYTGVCERDDGGFAATLWAQAEMAVEMVIFENEHVEETRLRVTAQWVARALAVLSFGPEFLIK